MNARTIALSSLLALAACGPKVPAEPPPDPEPAAPAPVSSSEVVERPVETPAEAPATEPANTQPPIGILACDEYLARYLDCEPQLMPDIQAGDRRDYRHERGWIEYMRDSPEGAQLAEACREMLRELNQVCPD